MRMTPLEKKIFDLAQPLAGDLALDLFCVKISGAEGALNLQVIAEDPETKRLGLDQCAQLSRAVSAVMDVEDPISGAYRLEVSSPGIDRFLVREQDFEIYAGHVAKLETEMPLESGQKRFRGVLKGIENGNITIDTDQGAAVIPFEALKKARLVLTDELIEATSNY